MAEHERFGGVVPEIASRAHLEAMVPTVHKALADAGVSGSDVDAVAVTSGPGLTGALLVGVAAAKAYAMALDVPLYGVNHLAAHVAVDRHVRGEVVAAVDPHVACPGLALRPAVAAVAGPLQSPAHTLVAVAGGAADQ